MTEKLALDCPLIPCLPSPIPPEVIERALMLMMEKVEREILGDLILPLHGQGGSTRDYAPQDYPAGECCPIIHRS